MLLAQAQHVLVGSPETIIFFGHGIGDDLLCTAVGHELKKRGIRKIVIFSRYKELFSGNPDFHNVWNIGDKSVARRKYSGLPCIIPFYGGYDAASDRDLMGDTHIIEVMCRAAGIRGEIELRPYIHLTASEKAHGRLFRKQAVIQSCGLRTAAGVMKNKEWYPERFQQVVDDLQGEINFVQLGNVEDPPLQGVIDLRGKTTLRESAAILANSMFFAGQVGFLMHLARAVDCRSAIVYGGREDPRVTGYRCNMNLTGSMPCAPCWQRNRCDYDKECMRQITADAVTDACRSLMRNACYPLDRECTVIEGS